MNKKLFFVLSAVFIQFAAHEVCAQDITETSSPAKIELLTKKDVRLFEVEALVKQEKYVDAIILIEDIIRQDVRTDEAYLLAAYSYMKLDKKDKARQTLVNALNLDKRNKAAHNYAGRLALLNERIRDAKNSLAAIKTICGGEDCAEYKDLLYRITEAENPKESAD